MRIERIQEKVVTDGVSKAGFTFYHRTGGGDVNNCINTIKSILSTGFRKGVGSMYGSGLYGTTDRKSSFRKDNIDTYGLGLLKYLVPIKGILVFDYNLAGLIFGTGAGKDGYPAYSLYSQLVSYGVFPSGKVPQIFKVLSDDLECTWGAAARTLSADRAHTIFVLGIMQGGNIVTLANSLKSVDQETIE